jgi:large subunit ribosomal protein L25
METVSLKATLRTENGKGPARRLRAGGQVPVVAYGKGIESMPCAVADSELRDILLSTRGRNTLIDLQVEGGKSSLVMVKSYTVHPVSRDLLHADLITVDKNEPIELTVPFRSTGKSQGEGVGGTLLVSARDLRVRCLPGNIPDSIVHDVTPLEIDDVVKVKDLQLPEGVEIALDGERKVLIVAPPRVQKAADTVDETAEGEESTEAAED